MADQKRYECRFRLSLFDYRVELNLNYYYNITRDVLDKKHLAISSGREEATANVANLHNKGIEIDLGITLLKMKRLQWFANFNIAYNKNTVKDTYYKSVDDLPTKISPGRRTPICRRQTPAGGWYGYRVAGINPMTGLHWYIRIATTLLMTWRLISTIFPETW